MLVERGRYIFNHGGAQKANKCLFEALAADGNECRAWTVLQGDARESMAGVSADLRRLGIRARARTPGSVEFTCDGVQVHAVESSRSSMRDLLADIADWRPDWVIASQDWSLALLEACLTACPRTLWIDHSPVRLPLGPFLSPLRARRVLGAAAGIVVRSEFHRRALFEEVGLPSFVYHFPVFGGSLPARCGHPGNRYVTMVNPSAIKGIDVFLGLARRLPAMDFAAIPSWATTSADRSALEREPNVLLLERGDDLDRIFATTKVLLVPSRWPEALGQVVIDAMLRGVPVIASDVGGLPEAKLGVDYLVPVTPVDSYLETLDDCGLPIPELPELDLEPWERSLGELTSSAGRYREVADASHAAARRYWEQLSLAPFYRYLEEIDRRLAARGDPGQCKPR
jgi:glycosyltransferase involved in cell wall biosynthesis